VSITNDSQLYYDPYNVEIDADPYPTYRRLRDEAPIYYNERLDFWALSRFADIEPTLRDVHK
jgi:cytochrome P450